MLIIVQRREKHISIHICVSFLYYAIKEWLYQLSYHFLFEFSILYWGSWVYKSSTYSLQWSHFVSNAESCGVTAATMKTLFMFIALFGAAMGCSSPNSISSDRLLTITARKRPGMLQMFTDFSTLRTYRFIDMTYQCPMDHFASGNTEQIDLVRSKRSEVLLKLIEFIETVRIFKGVPVEWRILCRRWANFH